MLIEITHAHTCIIYNSCNVDVNEKINLKNPRNKLKK